MKLTISEVKERAKNELTRCIEIANRVYKQKFDMPEIEIFTRGTTAGWAHDHKWRIRLNGALLAENPNEVESTTAHEFAHLVDYAVFPETRDHHVFRSNSGRIRRSKRSIHGPTWKSIMAAFGHAAARTHKMDTTNVRTKRRIRYTYKCPVCNRLGELGPKHHKAVQQGQGAIRFKACTFNHILTRDCYLGAKIPERPAPVAPREITLFPNNPFIGPVKLVPMDPKTANIPQTKQQRVVALLRSYPTDTPRSELIQAIIKNVGMTKAGAETYYYNAKRLLGTHNAA